MSIPVVPELCLSQAWESWQIQTIEIQSALSQSYVYTVKARSTSPRDAGYPESIPPHRSLVCLEHDLLHLHIVKLFIPMFCLR